MRIIRCLEFRKCLAITSRFKAAKKISAVIAGRGNFWTAVRETTKYSGSRSEILGKF
jgi:hypothetical protein